METYLKTVFRPNFGGMPPKRGPFGDATIVLKPDAEPKNIKPFHLIGDRRDGMIKLIKQLEMDGKIELGVIEWSSPAFPVPKKNPGEWRLVIDYRYTNDCTRADAHPLPRIGEIIQRQGKYKLWSVLDMKDGF